MCVFNRLDLCSYKECFYKQANCQAHGDMYEVAKSEERAARRLVRLKRQEIDSAQSVINKVKNAMSVEDIDSRVIIHLSV